jgi:uncharacterized protein YjbI with pentapeptide repeats
MVVGQISSMVDGVYYTMNSEEKTNMHEIQAAYNTGKRDFSGNNLRDANLCDAYLRGADLRYACLQGANLQDAYLRNVNLRDADLSRASLIGADLHGAYLRNANFRGADIANTCLIDGGQRSDGSRFVGHFHDNIMHIIGGYRYFTLPQAREHWTFTQGVIQLSDETLAILDHIERIAKIRKLDMGGNCEQTQKS